jgi:hypothetical protein
MPPPSSSSSKTPSGSFEVLQEYAHLGEVVALFASAIAEACPLLQETSEEDASVEIEGRLGVLGEGGFTANVGQQAFCSMLALLETCPQWRHVTGWTETQDVFYTVDVAPKFSGFERAARLRVRTSVGLDAAKQLTLVHVTKRRLRTLDMRLRSLGDPRCLGADASGGGGDQRLHRVDARLSISLEQKIPAEALPIAVVPEFVRIKQRKRFLLSSRGVEKPAFAIDATVVYAGKTKTEAEQRQAAALDPSYELEVECLEPLAYLQSCNQEEALLALSIILKLRDFAAAMNPSVNTTFVPA